MDFAQKTNGAVSGANMRKPKAVRAIKERLQCGGMKKKGRMPILSMHDIQMLQNLVCVFCRHSDAYLYHAFLRQTKRKAKDVSFRTILNYLNAISQRKALKCKPLLSAWHGWPWRFFWALNPNVPHTTSVSAPLHANNPMQHILTNKKRKVQYGDSFTTNQKFQTWTALALDP